MSDDTFLEDLIGADYTKCWKYMGKKSKLYFTRLQACKQYYNKELKPFDIYQICKKSYCINPTHFKIIDRDNIQLTESNIADDDLISILATLNDEPEVRENYIRAPLGYPGGKYRSLEYILPELPYRGIYCEPFGGSAAVLLARNESRLEVYNDRFGGITSFYRVLRDPKYIEALINRLELTVHSREEFIWCKETWEDTTDDLERAARWLYMHCYSFTNLGRHFGRSLNARVNISTKLKNNLKMFYPCHMRLRNVQIENLDWRICLRDYDKTDTVFYIDPPYLSYAKGVYRHEMLTPEHIELCERIFDLKGFVALSGYADDKTKELYGKYPWNKIKEWKSSTSMLSKAYSDTNNLKDKTYLDRSDCTTTEILYINE